MTHHQDPGADDELLVCGDQRRLGVGRAQLLTFVAMTPEMADTSAAVHEKAIMRTPAPIALLPRICRYNGRSAAVSISSSRSTRTERSSEERETVEEANRRQQRPMR